MEPNKFEKNIKEKLDERTIQPSADAWNKLSKRLDENNKRNNKPIWWFGIAASVVGILLITSQFFKNEVEAGDNHKIVVTPEIEKQDETNQVATEDVKNIDEVLEEGKSSQKIKINQSTKQKTVVKTDFKTENVVIAQTNNASKIKKEITESVKLIKGNLTFEDQKIQDVVAQVKQLNDSNVIVTDSTIDALLAEAQKEITLDKLYNKKTGVVDANLLLQDVEADIEQSFRDKVFKAIKESYGSVKTAIAQRNN